MHNLHSNNLRNVYDAMWSRSDNIPSRTLHGKLIEVGTPRQSHMSDCPRCFGRKFTVLDGGGAGSPISHFFEIVAHLYRTLIPTTTAHNRSILHFGTDFTEVLS